MSHEERIILNLLKASNEKGLKLAIKLYYSRLYNYALRLSDHQEVSEEITQDVFVNLWEKRQVIDIHSSLEGYLLKSIRHRVIDHHRTVLQKTSFAALEDHHLIEKGIPMLEHQELHDLIQKATRTLPQKCAMILRLSRFSGLSHREIAEELGIQEKTVENQITIALKRLKAIIEQNGYR